MNRRRSQLRACLILFVSLLSLSLGLKAQSQPKREFRGAWIQCVNGQFIGLGTERMQQLLSDQLDKLQACGINTIIFQVRGEGDALYASPYEPWSRFLTGRQGTPPSPYWDPLQWMITQCHKRGMEIHAWINPFRAKTKFTTELAVTHPYNLHPERFFAYDGLLLFDPGVAENRHYICKVASDIVRRYDVDGLHIDDYFYPYPTAGAIPDDSTYAANRNGFSDRGNWRRYNVNLFIKELHDSLRTIKPWVKFGVSPFGIYHNAKPGDPIPGSNTSGTQNYDDLYADVLYWENQGWIDYLVPQLYWEIGHPRADYDTLIRWWARCASKRPLYIGQDVERTVKAADLQNPSVNQMPRKYFLQRTLPGIQGSCQWYAAAVANNVGNYADVLRTNYHRTIALQPLMPFIDDKAPAKVKGVKGVWTPDGFMLVWREREEKNVMNKATKYVVYRFEKGEKVDIEKADKIVAVTSSPYYKLPYVDGKTRYTYVVTALDRMQNESKAQKTRVKL